MIEQRGVAGVVESEPAGAVESTRIALIGNPNTGKTTLFNRLCGLRHKTSNFPGTTQEARVGCLPLDGCCVGSPGDPPLGGGTCCREAGSTDRNEDGPTPRSGGPRGAPPELIDLPGIYSLELATAESALCRAVLAGETAPRGERVGSPDAVCIVADAANLSRNLVLAAEVLRRRLPTVIAVNMIDAARRKHLRVDREALEHRLGCEVVLISARTGEGLDSLRAALARARIPNVTPPGDEDALASWAHAQCDAAVTRTAMAAADRLTDRLDRLLTHPVVGLLCFAATMTGLFWVIFSLANYPMDWIDWFFARAAGAVAGLLPPGILADLAANGVVAGVGATVIFLPQICLLFFLISLLEDTGYLARAAFVVDRWLRPFGLSGHAFVPLLSSHACALPGIMATRAIPDKRERLAVILSAPFVSCSARIPVYVLLTSLLFAGRPAMAAVAFTGCYVLGAAAALLSALIARRTVARGRQRPMALELPPYRLPSLRTALVTTWDRGLLFLKRAGTAIVLISIVLWWLGSYPRVGPPAAAIEMRQQATAAGASDPGEAERLATEADILEASHAKAHTFLGQIGSAVEPLVRPLGYDRQLAIGVVASFAAREVFVSTMAVVVAGREDIEEEGVQETLKAARRDDGTPVFTTAVCWSLLVYYVLAMQCLPTLAVTAREAGGVRWALVQFAWMTAVAYLAAMMVYAAMR